MSENTLKLPKKYKRPSLEEFKAEGYEESNYDSYFARHEERLAAAYASGELTDEQFESAMDDADEEFDAEMTDADRDGLPDILHVKSQVRAPGNRTLRARQPTRHRFKQYLFGNPALRLVRKRATRIPADLVRSNLDELIAKEAAGILSVHAPNGQRVNLQALKAGRIELGAAPAPAPLVNRPLDSAANDLPAGENMPQHIGGTYAGDPIAAQVGARLAAEKQEEAEKKEPVQPAINPEDPLDPVAPVTDEIQDPALPTELEQPPMGVDGDTAPIQDQLPKDSEASVEAPAVEEEHSSKDETKSSKKGGKKGGHK